MRNLTPAAVLLFVATLAYVIGIRLNETAMAVVIGVIFGVLASVPTSVFLLFALRRHPESRAQERERREPPVVIVTPPGTGGFPSASWGPPSTYLPPIEELGADQDGEVRRFRVVGDDLV